ncbi:hypothetical protein AAG906_027270 [Vitis piasezkii]
MTQGSISFREAQVKVDRSFHYSPSTSQWSGGILEFEWHDTFRVNGHHLKPFIKPFKLEKEEINLLNPQKPDREASPSPPLKVSTAKKPHPSRGTRRESQIPLDMTPEEAIRRPMVTQPPIAGNLDCRARPFHSELCFDIATLKFNFELGSPFVSSEV